MKIYRVCKVRLENKHFIIYLIIPCVGTSEYMEGKNIFIEMGDISKCRKTITYAIGIATWPHEIQTLYIYIYIYIKSILKIL
jgi:hypothetical protein